MRQERTIERFDRRDNDSRSSLTTFVRTINEREDADQIWHETQKLLERKAYHVSENDYDPQKHVVITRFTDDFTTASVARAIEVSPWAAHKAARETLAAAIYVIGKDNGMPILEDIPDDIRQHYERFEEIEADREEIKRIVETDQMQDLISRSPALAVMSDQMIEEGVVSPLLDKLGIVVANPNSYTNLFFKDGYERGGTIKLMRRVLYGDWLQSESLYDNYYGQSIQRIFSKIAIMAYGNKFEDKIFARNMSHFASYLLQKEFESYIQNISVDTDWLFDRFALFDASFDANRGINLSYDQVDLNELAQRRLSRFLKDGRYQLSINPVHYYYKRQKKLGDEPMEMLIDFVKRYVEDSWRVPFCREISKYRGRKLDTARKIFDAGICAIDATLTLHGSNRKNIRENVKPSILVRQFSEYIQKVKEYKNTSK